MSKLDDLKMIHDRDKTDALGVAENQWQQLTNSFDIPKQDLDIQSIVYSGMGGSSLSAFLSQTWLEYNVPVEICRTYSIPKYVNKNTLFIATSFSGNTEETLEALKQAESKNAQIVCIASGGKLAEIAKEKAYPLAFLPSISQPRYATLSILRAIAEVLVAYSVQNNSIIDDLQKVAGKLRDILKDYKPDVPTDKNPTKRLALELMGSSPVVYASSQFFPVAYKWKISINENAKNVAWCNAYPEFNHNEFLGWTSHPVDKPYKIIDLRSSFDHPQIKKRFEISDRMLSGKRPLAEVVELKGDTILEQMVYGTTFGDFVSLYLALLNGLDPSPVDIIEKLKKNLA